MFFLICVVCVSCTTTQRLLKNNVVYSLEEVPGSGYKHQITRYTVLSNTKCKITDVGGKLFIELKELGTLTSPIVIVENVEDIGAAYQDVGRLYFAEKNDLVSPERKRNFMRYTEKQFVFQALTIPFKIRPPLSEYRDTFPTQIETGVNIGFAGGYKFKYKLYSAPKDIMGNNTKEFSFTPGIFFGLGATDIKPENTRPQLEFARKALVVTPGIFVMLGYNRINLGYTIAWDIATGTNSSDWVYQRKLWHGFILALDIIK